MVAVPLVLLGAGHMKNDGPGALARARLRHPGVDVAYGRDLGVHPTVLALAEARAREAMAAAAPSDHATVLVGRGSSDPDANSELYKACRLVWDRRRLGMVEPAFVSLAPPGVSEALQRCPGWVPPRITVVPYFLFAGVLPDRIRAEARAWASRPSRRRGPRRPTTSVRCPNWPAWCSSATRRRGAGDAHMNCDCCAFRTALPGYEERVGRPLVVHGHAHDHRHHDHH